MCYQLFQKFLKEYKLMSLHVDHFFSLNLFGYRKGFTTQQALLPLIEKWKMYWIKGICRSCVNNS